MRLDLVSAEGPNVWQHAIELPSFEARPTSQAEGSRPSPQLSPHPSPHPALSLCHLSLREDPLSLTEDRSWLLFAGTTDGSVQVWKLEEGVEEVKAMLLVTLPSVHQSGINGLAATWVHDQGQEGRTIKVVTAGDDQALTLTTLAFSQARGGEVTMSDEPRRLPSAHSSAIKSLGLHEGSSPRDSLLFTVGLDQRVRCWSFGPDLKDLILRASMMVDVPEPCDLFIRRAEIHHEVMVIVAGRGVQALTVGASSGQLQSCGPQA